MKDMQQQVFLSGKTAVIIIIIVLLAAAIFLWTSSRKEKHQPSNTAPRVEQTGGTSLTNLELPALRPGEQVITHTAYSLSYNEEHEQANWVAYKLKGQQINSFNHARTDKFLEDPKVATGTAADADYKGSGYDRGHLAPAEDMDWSGATMSESFYYSNISPQVPTFNRGVWRRLEELTRFWASYYDSIFVVTGPVLKEGLPTTGSVSVPRYFYKVILEHNNNKTRAIGFVLPNKASSATLKSFAVSVDSVEQLTGLDFFPRLPDDVEHRIESDASIEDWQWTRKKKN